MTEAERWLAQAERDLDDAGGIPADAYTHTDGERALSLSTAVIDLVRAMLPMIPKHR